MKRFTVLALAILLPSAAVLADEPSLDFNKAIGPIFKTYCVGCHNSQDKEGGLVLESFETLGKGGENGPVVVPGKPDDSKLVQVLLGKAEPAMPPEGNERPSDAQITALRAWIAAGAKPPSAAAPDPAVLETPKIPLSAPARKAINAAAWSPDGKLIAVGSYGEVRLLSAESRGLVRRLAAPAGGVTDLTFTTEGKALLAAGGEPGLFGEVVMADVATGQPLRTFKGHKDSLYALALSPDGKLLATGSYDQQILLWDVSDGRQVGALEGHSGAVFDLAFNHDGRLLASASADRTAKLWDVAARKRLDTFAQPVQELYAVAFSPDGQRVAAGGVDNRIRVWQISASAQEGTNPILYSKFAHQAPIIKLLYSPNGKILASVAEDRSLRLFKADTLEELRSLDAQPDWAPALAFAPDSKRLFVGRADGSFAIYDASTGEEVPPPRPELASLAPRGVMRGQPARVTLVGKNLLGATRVEANSDQITASLSAADIAETADRITVELKIVDKVSRGMYELSVATPAGKSGPVKIYVDDIPQIEESEPNDTPAQAVAANLPAGFWGTVSAPGDEDCYQFEAASGQTLVFELAARSLGSKLNAVLTLCDAAGAVLASNNDIDGDDPLLTHTFAAAGKFTLRVSDLAQAGSADHFYHLSAGPFAYVTGCYPIGVPAGRPSDVELTGYNLPAGAKASLPAADRGEIPVPIDTNSFRLRKPLKVLVGSLPEVMENEPNDRPEDSTAVVAPVTVNGRISARSGGGPATADVDLFRFDSKAGQQWIIETDAARRGSPVDTRIEVLDAQGKPVERLLLQAVRDSAINFRSINSQSADVRVDNWEEMELNEFMYLGGEVCKIFRLPQGPDSGFLFYNFAGSRICYFDTSATSHAVGEACYIVEPHPSGTALAPNGLPVFALYYANDDDGRRRLGRDSRLTFTAGVEGSYLVRVSDVRRAGGDHFAYRLTIRPPRPDFVVTLGGTNPAVKAGSGRSLSLTAERIDNFDGDITVEITGLPPGFAVSSPVVIPAGHTSAEAVIYAAADAPKPSEQNNHASQVSATAIIDGSPVTKPVNGIGTIKLAPAGNVVVRIEPAELTIAPGSRVTAKLKVERHGFDGRIRFDVQNLPHGVIVDNIGLNGVLIPEGQNERDIFLTARSWVPETTRTFFALTQEPAGEASPPAVLHVRRGATVAQAASSATPPSENK
jgi:WD40 repeat protein